MQNQLINKIEYFLRGAFSFCKKNLWIGTIDFSLKITLDIKTIAVLGTKIEYLLGYFIRAQKKSKEVRLKQKVRVDI